MAGKAEINLNDFMDKEKIDKLLKSLHKSIKNQSRKDLEMAITQKLNEITLTGKFQNGMIVLDDLFNGAKSWKLDKKYDGQFWNDEKISVTFRDNKLTGVKRLHVKQVKNQETKKEKQKLYNQLPEHGFYLTDEQQSVLTVASKAFNDIDNPYKGFVVALKGEAGTGKTSVAEYFSNDNKIPLLTIDCSTIPDNESWFVNPAFKNGETRFDLTNFSEFLMSGNCAILFDEINRMPTWVSNSLLPILDHRRQVIVRGINVKANNKIAFFMTSNEGVAYAGTNPIDKAIERRTIGTIICTTPPEDIETEILIKRMKIEIPVAENIVKIFTRLRANEELKEFSINLATGTSLNVAFWVKYGASIREAFKTTISNSAPYEASKIIMDSLSLTGN